jgi:golgin subfamily A member 4
MSDLDDLTNKIRERLTQQNQILKDCVVKYQNSQKERKDIADNIQKITTELADATKNLQEIEKNHNEFNIAKSKKIQQYEGEKQEMNRKYSEEKVQLEKDKNKAIQDEVSKTEKLKKELEQKAIESREKGVQEQKAKDEQKAADRQKEFDEAKQAAEDKINQQKEDITNFQNRLKNDKETADAERKKLQEAQQKLVGDAKTNEEKILTLTNQNKELHTKIENDNLKHKQEIDELAKKGKEELDKANENTIQELTKQKETLTQQEKQHIEELNIKNQDDMKKLQGQMFASAESSNATNKAELDAVQGKLKLCNEKFQAFETEYAKNKESLDDIQKQFKDAENIAAAALKENVDKLTAENSALLEQIRKMSKESKVVPPPALSFDELSNEQKVKISEVVNEMKNILEEKEDEKIWWRDEHGLKEDELTNDNKINALLKAEEGEGGRKLSENEEKMVISRLKSQVGGYKHGKKSNKRMKRSLKSKLSARKFSLKKRSKIKKKKGKSKKMRKSIKIRI